MRKLPILGLLLAISSSAFAGAPGVASASQKGSLIVFPDIRVDYDWNTIVRIENDGSTPVNVSCTWMDGNKNRSGFVLTMTSWQPLWFEARTGKGSTGVPAFPNSSSNGFDNPFLVTPPATGEDTDTAGPYRRGLLACWAVNANGDQQVRWNHLSGTATVFHPAKGAYEYNAYGFFEQKGLDLSPVGEPGVLKLDGLEYDMCPQYQIAQFAPMRGSALRLAIVACNLFLNQDWTPVYTKYVFDQWSTDDVKLTGAFRCADSWHESPSGTNPLYNTAIRYRVQGVTSTQCLVNGEPVVTQNVGVLAVQSMSVDGLQSPSMIGSTLASSGKFPGRIVWDPATSVPEGGAR